ncbi:MAG: response regulator transcription factor [Gaiellaceae bacterium]
MTPSHTVLIVDDAASIRLLCRVNLELDGFRVLEAGTLDEARAAIESEHVDIALLDVHIGREDGFQFLHELRRDHPGLPVAMLTGTAAVEEPRLAEADAVLGKPFELEELRGVVRTLASVSHGSV